MAVRQRRVDGGVEGGGFLVGQVGREFKGARLNAGLSQQDVADAVGISRPQYGRIERGRSPQVSLVTIATIAAVLGLEASLRPFPVGDPIRDAGHVALLQRFGSHLHDSLAWRTEVAFPRPRDPRAWDGIVSGFRYPANRMSRRGAVEAETRPVDVQALERKLGLKERDGGADLLILLLADTRHNRALLVGASATLRSRFPLDGRRALELLADGVDPAANAIVLL